MPRRSEPTASTSTCHGVRNNHLCWVYADPGEFRARATAFLYEGLTAGQRVGYLARGSAERAWHDLGEVTGVGVLLSSPDFEVGSVDDWYPAGQALTPHEQIAHYAAAARAAVAEGYSGLRVAVEATDLVSTGPQRDMFARYEHLIDRCMVDEPFAAMCGYDEAELGHPVAAELACLHPRVPAEAASFQWFAASYTDMVLSGVIDLASVGLFDVTLTRTLPLLAGPRLAIDARQLDFIDHRGLLTLERHARANELQITLHTRTATVHRLADLLGLQAVSPQEPR